jgi:hypothetical protein
LLKLIKKVAVSSSISFEKRWTISRISFPSTQEIMQQTILYLWEINVSQKYTNYKQTNINLMVEFVGQTINENGNHI